MWALPGSQACGLPEGAPLPSFLNPVNLFPFFLLKILCQASVAGRPKDPAAKARNYGQLLEAGFDKWDDIQRYIHQALRICLEWCSEAIYFSTHPFELIHHTFFIFLKTNKINYLLTEPQRKILEEIFLIFFFFGVLAPQKS